MPGGAGGRRRKSAKYVQERGVLSKSQRKQSDRQRYVQEGEFLVRARTRKSMCGGAGCRGPQAGGEGNPTGMYKKGGSFE